MTNIIEFGKPKPKTYSVDIEQYPGDLHFTVNGVKVNRDSLTKVADELERIVQIIRTDVLTGII
jgi:hypothetical protein